MDRRDFAVALADLPRRRDQVLPALHAAHALHGWLPEPAIETVSDLTSVPLSELYGIISSYSELRLAPPPSPLVEVCTGLSCLLAGADELLAAVERAGMHVERVPCRFLCGVAPVADLQGRYLGRLTADSFVSTLRNAGEPVA
jgi:NADH:ubiquinone oxidoreductase subunit E